MGLVRARHRPVRRSHTATKLIVGRRCHPRRTAVPRAAIENLLVGDIAGIGAVGRLLPGAAGRAIGGQDPTILLSPAVGLVVLILYAAAAGVMGSIVTVRRDFV